MLTGVGTERKCYTVLDLKLLAVTALIYSYLLLHFPQNEKNGRNRQELYLTMHINTQGNTLHIPCVHALTNLQYS